MIGERRALALIPARGGSKGLPGKNILPINGRPLLSWTIDAAMVSSYIDRVVLSSDDEAIMAAGRACGCEVPFRRPGHLASDTASSLDVVVHAVDQLGETGVVVLLQPTSPLRTAADIDAACRMLEVSGAPACVSVVAVEQNPYWMYRVDARGRLQALISANSTATRRQDLPEAYLLNGAIYVADVAWLKRMRTFVTDETVAYIMPAERSLDIDTHADLEAFKKVLSEQSHEQVST